MKICKVKNCNRKYYAKGYCRKHYTQIKNYKKTLTRTARDKNEIIKYKNYAEVCLYNKHNIEVARTIIDLKDINKIKKYKWNFNTTNSSAQESSLTHYSLHRLLLSPQKKQEILHINNNNLDNRRKNLLLSTRSQIMMRSNRGKGYYWHKKNKRWMAQIKVNYKSIFLGCFKDEKDAIKARKKARKKYFKV